MTTRRWPVYTGDRDRLSKSIAVAGILLAVILLSGSQALLVYNRLAAFAQSPPISANDDGVSIISVSTRYSTDEGSFHLDGEIKNVRDFAVENVKLNATFYDNNGVLIGTSSGSTYVQLLRPGEKSAFDISIVRGADTLSNYSYYTISKSWNKASDEKPALLQMKVDELYIDNCGTYHIGGIITNLGPIAATETIVSATFYNDKNQVITSAITTPQLDKDTDGTILLRSTNTARFEFTVDKSAMAHFAYYSLNAQSKEYALKKAESATEFSPALAVYTDSLTYPAGGANVTVVAILNPALMQGAQGPDEFVLLRILSDSGDELYKISAFPSSTYPGQFSRSFDFFVPNGSEGKVIRVVAEYKGQVAQTTYSIARTEQTSGNVGNLACATGERYQLGLETMRLAQGGDNGTVSVPIPYPGGDQKMVAGSPVTISIGAKNELSSFRTVTIVLQVLDSQGTVVFLHLGNLTIDPNSSAEGKAIWTPDRADMFKIKSFIISGLEEPRILSAPSESVARVQR